MAYDEHLAERIRSILDARKINYLDKKMMGGLVFMVDDKMCIGIVKDNLMARIGEEKYPEALQKDGCKEMNFTGRPLKGYVFVEPQAVDMEDELEYWVKLCLDFNPLAKASKNRK